MQACDCLETRSLFFTWKKQAMCKNEGPYLVIWPYANGAVCLLNRPIDSVQLFCSVRAKGPGWFLPQAFTVFM